MFSWLKRKPKRHVFDLIRPSSIDGLDNIIDISQWPDNFDVIFNSQKVEGSTLSVSEAFDIIECHIAPDREKSLVDAYNLYGSFQSWTPLVEHLENNILTPQDLRDIHKDALAGESHAGLFRSFPAFIGSIEPPMPETVPEYIDSFCSILAKLDLNYRKSAVRPRTSGRGYKAQYNLPCCIAT